MGNRSLFRIFVHMDSRFLLFKASAGSGKTFNLALQYIALLVVKGEHEFKRTLAVTFTNDATAEMKNRILEFLFNFWQGRKPKDFEALKDTLKEDYGTTLPDEDVRERCHKALSAILHDYSRFSISTIDAFFQTVLRNMAHELGLNARLQVDLNDKEVVDIAVETLIENLNRDDKDVLPYLKQYIEQKLDEGYSWDVRRELKRVAKMLFHEKYLKRSLEATNKPFTIENITQYKKELDEAREEILKPLNQSLELIEQKVKNTGLEYEELISNGRFVRGYVENLKAGKWEVNFNATLEKMTTSPLSMLNGKLRKDASMLPVIQELSQQLAKLREQHIKVKRLANGIDLALENLAPMGLLETIDKEVSRLSNERNRFMLARTPIMLKRMIDGNDSSFIFERIGTRYQNIMIDEFQDTSRLQWENFRVLLLDNLASGGLSMVVGDIKQSIYRWRNGDWRILADLEQQGHNGIKLIPHPLNDNWRSMGNIVDFNNNFFPMAAEQLDTLSNDDDIHLIDFYNKDVVKQHVMKHANEGYVRICLKHSKDKEVTDAWEEEMLADLCQQVTNLHTQGLPYSEMTILLRKRIYIEPLINYFAEHMKGVQLVSGEAFLLNASVAVNMIVCALQLVDDIERDPVAMRYLMKHYLSDVMKQRTTESDYCQADYLNILPATFLEQLNSLRELPLYELCEALYRILSINEIEGQDAYIFTFFDELATYLRDNPSDIPTFLQHWNDQMQTVAIPKSEADGIRIYTIHMAKGLAFHTVLMPFAEWTIEKDHFRKDPVWCKATEPPLCNIGTLPIKFSSKVKDSAFDVDYFHEHANLRADELNALYVAFTRPKANLFVWGLSKEELTKGKDGLTIADLIYAVLQKESYEEGKPSVNIGDKTDEIGKEEALRIGMHSYDGNLSFRQSNEAEAFVRKQTRVDGEEIDTQQLDYIEQGKLLHYIFSKIETADDIDYITSQFARQGLLKSEQQLQHVRKLASNGLRHERVQDWFSGRYRLFNERSILVPDEETGKIKKKRPDRVMMDDQRIIVVDFKFGKENEDYITQVEEYMNILQTMHPNRIVEGWLWYVYKNKVVRVKA